MPEKNSQCTTGYLKNIWEVHTSSPDNDNSLIGLCKKSVSFQLTIQELDVFALIYAYLLFPTYGTQISINARSHIQMSNFHW